MKDLIKALIVFPAYLFVGPMIGLWLKGNRTGQRWLFGLMLFMTSWQPGKITLMLNSIETYRGHTKGFEFSFIEVLAVGLLVACRRTPMPGGKMDRLVPWGVWAYLFWTVVCCFGIVNAYEPIYVLMGFWKFSKAVLLLWAAYHFFRDEDDLPSVLRAMAFMLVVQALVGLKMRVLEGRFQIKGWFEHQNPMAMWAYMTAIPVAAAAFAPQPKTRDWLFYVAGLGAAALCILLSVSRAALAFFALGVMAVLGLAMLRGLNQRTIGLAVVLAVGGGLAGLVATDSLRSRMDSVKEAGETSELDLRDVMILQSKAMLADHFLGVGWNNFGIANSRPRGDKYSEILEEWERSRGHRIYDEDFQANPLTESLYWLFLAENGWPGFLAFFVFAAFTLWWCWKAWRRGRGMVSIFAGAWMVALSLFYVHGLVERILTQTKNLSLWLLVTGFVGGLAARGTRKA